MPGCEEYSLDLVTNYFDQKRHFNRRRMGHRDELRIVLWQAKDGTGSVAAEGPRLGTLAACLWNAEFSWSKLGSGKQRSACTQSTVSLSVQNRQIDSSAEDSEDEVEAML